MCAGLAVLQDPLDLSVESETPVIVLYPDVSDRSLVGRFRTTGASAGAVFDSALAPTDATLAYTTTGTGIHLPEPRTQVD